MTAATAPTLPGHAPEFPAGPSQAMREIFAVDDLLKNVFSDHELENQKKLAAAYDRAVRELVGPNDVMVETVYDKKQGAYVDREYKLKSAWKKLAKHFRIDVVEVSHRVFFIDGDEFDMRDDPRRELVAEVKMRGIAPWGQVVETLGACTTYEKRFGKDMSKAWHDCLATAQTRASNRAISDLIAAGEVSAEEITGETKGEEKESAPAARREAASKKEKPAREKRMPMGHSKGKLLGELDTKDLESAAKWCRENNKFPDLVSAIADVLAERQKDQGKLELDAKQAGGVAPPDSPVGKKGDPAPTPSGPAREADLSKPRNKWSAAQLTKYGIWLLEHEPSLTKLSVETLPMFNGLLMHDALVTLVTTLEDMVKDAGAARKAEDDSDGVPF